MQSKKEENLFKKFVKKNYKNELEEVLENKFFGENAKSLLLEILYKIETAYKDYELVKKDAKTKEEYIENYITIIKQKCKTIKIVKPNSEQSKLLGNRTFTINKKRSEITCLPIARKLLYAISKLDKKEKIVNDKYYLLSNTLSNLINIGDCINTVEPLREFNGWSWTTVAREVESLEYNLIYQNILILIGQKFIEDWIKKGDSIIDYIEKFENQLSINYGEKRAKYIIKCLNELSVLMEIKVNPSIMNDIKKSKKELEKMLENFNNKQAYIEELTTKKNKLQNEILRIDTTINDRELLQNEYLKRNEKLSLDEKIFSIRVLIKIMIEEREKIYKEYEECNMLLKPQNFLIKKEETEKEYNILKLAFVKDLDSKIEEKIIYLQKLFLECLKIKIEMAESKQKITNLIYRYRYYCLLPFSLDTRIYEIKSIQNIIKTTGQLLIKKAINNKIIEKFANDEEVNYEIMKNIFRIRIISLEELSIKIYKDNGNFFMQFFDDKTSDQIIKLDLQDLNKNDLSVRLNKKIKLFM
ncbi:MAG: hypothetical protein IKF83_03715 [Clostridia bacterium]|nr:hypothetical protein [Clostridia bacterium]